ncbi:MAG: TRAP transporter small permease [Methylobacteriaceae bacterium]|jgi:TRAP-type C4-dicarboxylate transport system permease small subunit|nr:TRAP transporter small permease [Methylobacteriaceae bacterium]
MALLTVTVGIQVFARYVMNSPLSWGEQLAQFSFIWMTLLGAALATRTNDNLAVTALYERFTGKRKHALQILIDLTVIVVAILWAYSGILQIMYTWDLFEAGINIRLGIVYLVFPVAFALTMLFAAEDIIKNVAMLRGKQEGEP